MPVRFQFIMLFLLNHAMAPSILQVHVCSLAVRELGLQDSGWRPKGVLVPPSDVRQLVLQVGELAALRSGKAAGHMLNICPSLAYLAGTCILPLEPGSPALPGCPGVTCPCTRAVTPVPTHRPYIQPISTAAGGLCRCGAGHGPSGQAGTGQRAGTA